MRINRVAAAVLLLSGVAQNAHAGSDRVKMWIRDLSSEVGEVRAGAALALGEAGDPRAITPLQSVLGDEYVDVRKAAAWSLGELGDKTSAKPLSMVLEKDRAPAVRVSAAQALGKIRESSTAGSLEGAIGDNDAAVRGASIEALARVDRSKAVADAEKMLTDDTWTVRLSALAALGDMRSNAAMDRICAVLGHDDSDYVRAGAAHALGKIADKGAVPALEKALNDPSDRVRGEAAAALLAMGVHDSGDVSRSGDHPAQGGAAHGTVGPAEGGAVEL